jgi:hypothetical protein
MSTMQLFKTDRATSELKPGNRTLTQRERTLLLMADGSKSIYDFRTLFDGAGEKIALKLLQDGFLEVSANRKPEPLETRPVGLQIDPAPAPAVQVAQPALVVKLAQPLAPEPVPRESASSSPNPDSTQAIRASSDQFEGKRSLATTRMFLFDICERMFARRDPVLAERFREALRVAKTRETMLSASRDMLEEIEKVAGHARADSISERLAMMLPPEDEPSRHTDIAA